MPTARPKRKSSHEPDARGRRVLVTDAFISHSSKSRDAVDPIGTGHQGSTTDAGRFEARHQWRVSPPVSSGSVPGRGSGRSAGCGRCPSVRRDAL